MTWNGFWIKHVLYSVLSGMLLREEWFLFLSASDSLLLMQPCMQRMLSVRRIVGSAADRSEYSRIE